jgi:hypothetical protein
MRGSAPAGLAGQELNLKPHKLEYNKNSTKNQQRLPLGKNRVMILEQIADKWVRQGLYQSPSRAMFALLGGVHD